jgi:Glycosidases
MLDMVFNHTSTQHEWFQKAMQGDLKYKNYYIWHKGKAPDEAPNNWQSKFGGPAWEYVEKYDEWYLHLFDVTQADLNWDNPEVRAEMADIVNFWLAKGVHAAPKQETLRVMHLDGHSQYEVTGRSHILFLHPRTAAMKQGRLTESREGVYAPEENYQASGNALKQGIRLPYLFNGYFTKEIRIPGDFGSEMYYIKKIEK